MLLSKLVYISDSSMLCYSWINKEFINRENVLILERKDCMTLNYKSQLKHLFVRYKDKHNLKNIR